MTSSRCVPCERGHKSRAEAWYCPNHGPMANSYREDEALAQLRTVEADRDALRREVAELRVNGDAGHDLQCSLENDVSDLVADRDALRRLLFSWRDSAYLAPEQMPPLLEATRRALAALAEGGDDE